MSILKKFGQNLLLFRFLFQMRTEKTTKFEEIREKIHQNKKIPAENKQIS